MAEMIRLDIDSDAIQYLCGKDKRLARVIEMVGASYIYPVSGQLFFYRESDHRADVVQ